MQVFLHCVNQSGTSTKVLIVSTWSNHLREAPLLNGHDIRTVGWEKCAYWTLGFLSSISSRHSELQTLKEGPAQATSMKSRYQFFYLLYQQHIYMILLQQSAFAYGCLSRLFLVCHCCLGNFPCTSQHPHENASTSQVVFFLHAPIAIKPGWINIIYIYI